MSDSSKQFKSGVIAAAAAYFCWGLFPVFWKLLDGVPSLELMAHRIVWCGVTVVALLIASRQAFFWRGTERRVLALLSVSAALIAINWWVYIWAVGHDKIVESSLGYFINPLVNVVFGVVFLRERLNRAQWFAVAVAASGVLYLTLQMGTPPWIALALALSFGSYGLIRKLAIVDAMRGLAIESAWLLLPALALLTILRFKGQNHFDSSHIRIDFLMMASGPITAVPLLLFAYGARRIPLSLIGILQYIGPTLQFVSGVFIYREPFTTTQLIGFGLTWIALVVYAIDGVVRYAKQPATQPA